VNAVGQQNDVCLGVWIDPERSAGEACMAERADREQLAAVARVGRIDIPAEPAQNRLIGRGLRFGEFLNRGRAHDAHAVQLAAIQHHLREAGQISGGGEHAGMAGYAAMLRAVGSCTTPRSGGYRWSRAPWVRCVARALPAAGTSYPACPAAEDVIARVIGKGLSAQAVHQLAEQDEIDVAIDEARAGRPVGRIRAG